MTDTKPINKGSTPSDAAPVSEGFLFPIYSAYASIRYFFVRSLCCPVPFMPQTLPVIGGKTLLEIVISILVLLIVAAMVFTRGDPNSIGTITQYLGVIMILLALRRISFMSFFGISFERALYWHKLVAICYLFSLMTHGIKEGFNTTGVAMGVLSGVATVAYLSAYMKFSFNLFYYFHVLMYVGIAPLAVIHGGKYFGLIAIVWGVDLFVRYLLQGRKVDQAKLSLVGDGMVRVEVLDNPFHASRSTTALLQAGMYCFIMVPKINYYEYHPFSIASGPSENQLTFFIKADGDWTESLRDIAKQGCGGESGEVSDIPIYLEGPYGNLSIDIFDAQTYPVALLVSGGVGITPMLSILKQFIHLGTHGKLSGMKRVIFVWVCRESALANDFYNKVFIPLCLQYLTPAPAAELKERLDLVEGSLWKLRSGDDLRFEFHYYMTRGKIAEMCPSVEFTTGAVGNERDDCCVGYMGNVPISAAEKEIACSTCCWNECRPAWDTYYEVAANLTDEVHKSRATTCVSGAPRISVASCGPDELVAQVRANNQKFSSMTGIKIDCHEEFFNF
jgi:hypothetical protein